MPDSAPPINALISGPDVPAALPEVCARIDQAIRRPSSSLAEISDLLEYEPAICAKVLRLANSCLYCSPRRIDAISTALTIIGTRQLGELVLASFVVDAFAKLKPSGLCRREFWRHSVACGLIARGLASRRREANVETFFVVGLMHDLGGLLMQRGAPELMAAVRERHTTARVPVPHAERDLFGYDHADAASALLNAWGLPESMVEGVGRHHDWSALHQPQMTAVVHIADVIATAIRLGDTGERFVSNYAPAAWRELHLEPAIIADLVADAERQLDDVTAFFLADAEHD